MGIREIIGSGRLAVFTVCLALACFVLYLCYVAAYIVIPFVVAIFIWYLINALARFFGVLKGLKDLPRSLRVAMAIFLLAAMVLTISGMVEGNIADVRREAPKFQESFEKVILQTADMLNVHRVPTMKEIVDDIIMKHVDIGGVMTAFAGMLTGFVGNMVIVLVFVALLFYEQQFFNRKLARIFPERTRRENISRILTVVDSKIQKYIGVKATVSFLDSFLTYAALSFFNVDFAGFWGVMAFFLHFIPYAGSFVAISMPVLISFIQYGDVHVFMKVLTTLCISHAFLGHILDPYLMGNNLNLSPIFIISNLAMWGMLWGMPGMFLAIPILAVVTIVLGQFERTRPIAVLFSKTGVITPKEKAA
jgi:AI-2 transport protein TqsA